MSNITRAELSSLIIDVQPLTYPFTTLDPFIRCSYHKDHFPTGDVDMKPPKVGDGNDFASCQPWRMYYGKEYPGFPKHAHRGYEILTLSLEGFVDHADARGNGGRYGNGDMQWTTTGRGLCHSEMFPLVYPDRPNPLRLFQIWLNMPASMKCTDPSFLTYWAHNIPRLVTSSGHATVTVWVGDLLGSCGCEAPATSWAHDRSHDIGVFLIELAPGGNFTLPAARPCVNRVAYFVEGQAIQVGDRALHDKAAIKLVGTVPAPFRNLGGEAAQVLVLQGRPIQECVAQQGPFVANFQSELPAIARDYAATKFGAWPWPSDGHVFPKHKGRFARIGGKEYTPP